MARVWYLPYVPPSSSHFQIGLYREHVNYFSFIITRGLYIFTPFFSAVYNQERLILQTS